MKLSPILLLAFLLPAISFAAESYDPTDDLLSAFGETCSVRGDVNQRARVQGQALVSIISLMKSDPTCAGLAPMVENLQSQILYAHSDISAASIEIDQRREQAADLDQAIQVEKSKGVAKDQLFIDSAELELRNLRMDILREQSGVTSKKRKNAVTSIDAARVSANQVLTALASTSQCAAQRPNIAGQVVGRLLSITSLLNPGVGGAIALGVGSVFENLMTFFSERKYNKSIAAIRKDQLMDGIGCGLEALAATQCMARDTMITLKEMNRNIITPPECSESVRGAELLGRHMPNFIAWVKNFRDASGSSRSLEVIDDAQQARQLDFNYDLLASSANRSFADFEKKGDTPTSRKELVEDVGNRFLQSMQQGIGMERLFEEDRRCGPLLFLYSAGMIKARDKLPENIAGTDTAPLIQPQECLSYVASKKMTSPSPESVRATADKVLSSVRALLDEKKTRLKKPDPQIIIASAETKGPTGLAPLEVLQGLNHYLVYLQSDTLTSSRSAKSFKNLAADNAKRIENVLASYNDDAVSDAQLARVIITNIGHEDFLRNISEIVRQDIERKTMAGKFNEGFKMIAEASNASALSELTNYVNDTERLYASANAASVHSDSNLKTFTKTFEEPFEEVLKDLQGRAAESKGAKNMLGLSCMRALLTRTTPEYLEKYCKGTGYEGLIGGRISYDDWKTKGYDDRACSLFDYFRKTRVKESRGSLKNAN